MRASLLRLFIDSFIIGTVSTGRIHESTGIQETTIALPPLVDSSMRLRRLASKLRRRRRTPE
ncbi:hypothetical protein TZ00_05620 [Agreia bicolorata]|uniref:Secreted protein n=1 Tax=Agreia bicolorata TaxID=110935 RepID=A0ABR5CHK1_9MICO|nr:hypothetical protein TZ00_05620 [Agreia bicolorata]